jgi:hypothetical protein
MVNFCYEKFLLRFAIMETGILIHLISTATTSGIPDAASALRDRDADSGHWSCIRRKRKRTIRSKSASCELGNGAAPIRRKGEVSRGGDCDLHRAPLR